MEKTCINCEWWEYEHFEVVLGTKHAECKAALPERDEKGIGRWPLVSVDDRCKHWEPRIESREKKEIIFALVPASFTIKQACEITKYTKPKLRGILNVLIKENKLKIKKSPARGQTIVYEKVA